jgi:predicted RNase H-like HicB family nuclease
VAKKQKQALDQHEALPRELTGARRAAEMETRPRPKVKVMIYEAEEGGYWAQVPALPGCLTQGETYEELLVNLREAIEGYLLCTPGDYEPEEGGKEEEIEL